MDVARNATLESSPAVCLLLFSYRWEPTKKRKLELSLMALFFRSFFLMCCRVRSYVQGKGNKYNAAHRRRGVSGGRGARKRNAERKEREDEWHFESTTQTSTRLMMEESGVVVGWALFALRRPYRAHGAVVGGGKPSSSSFTDIRKQKEEEGGKNNNSRRHGVVRRLFFFFNLFLSPRSCCCVASR